MHHTRALLIAGFYFISVFFAVTALEPTLAVPFAWFAVLLAMLVYLLVDTIGMEKAGLLLAMLIALPFSCLVAGLVWWLMRWTGLWVAFK